MPLAEVKLNLVPEQEPPRYSLLTTLRDRFRKAQITDTVPKKIGFALTCDVSAIQAELDSYLLPQKTERHLRLFAWYLINHTSRPSELPLGWTDGNKARLLLLMTASNVSTRITRAELLRQLGRFDEALDELTNVQDTATNAELLATIELALACRQKRSDVFELDKSFDPLR